MIIECRKGEKAFSRLIRQPFKKPNVAFCFYIIETEIDKFPSGNLLANLRFAVEIYQFRLSIVVIYPKKEVPAKAGTSKAIDNQERGTLGRVTPP